MIRVLAASISGIALAVAAPALGADEVVIVRLGGIHHDNARDIAKLNRSLSQAVEKVCGSYSGASPSEQDEIKSCRRQAREGIDRQLVQMRAKRLAGLEGSRGIER
jgi:UrcA family protein